MPDIIPRKVIEKKIYEFRGKKVILDRDLAELYGVETRTLNQAVKRNEERFPQDFMFRLNTEEFRNLRSQTVTSSWGGTRYPPRAFTEHGILMLSNVLKSERAVKVSIQIIRVFNAMREMIGEYNELIGRLQKIERRQDIESKEIWKAIRLLRREILDKK
jgi:hypothetical protein